MNIKQEYKEDGKEFISFTYIGGFEGVIFDGNFIKFYKHGKEVSFHIGEVEELIPYFTKWIRRVNYGY